MLTRAKHNNTMLPIVPLKIIFVPIIGHKMSHHIFYTMGAENTLLRKKL